MYIVKKADMGVEYLSIDSQFQEHHEQDSKIHVQLPRPIENAKSVRLVSFSTANEFFNIDGSNNIFTLVSYTAGNLFDEPAIFPIQFEPGYYQASEIIEELNAALIEEGNGQGGSSPGFDLVSVTLFQLSDLRTQITMQAGIAAPKRVVIYVEPDKLTSHSIAARLGFNQDQVVTTLKPGLFPTTTTALQEPFYKNEVLLKFINYIVWQPPIIQQQVKISKNSAYETHSHIFVESDLVTDFRRLTIENNSKNFIKSHILCKIPCTVNRGSWLHYENTINENMSHTLSGNVISNFSIWLSDENYNVFQKAHYRKYNVVLAFTTQDKKDLINEQSIQAMERLALEKKYNVM